jgi:hypothetical protein
MFFYLLYNSTILEKEIDEYNRSIKVLIYGSIAYIILHAVLFVGGEEALLYSLKIYFWLFLILDFIVLGLMFNRKNGNSQNVFELIFNRNKKQNNVVNNQINDLQQQNLPKKSALKRKTVRFKNYESESESDSDSDIGTDIDLTAFKESLLN